MMDLTKLKSCELFLFDMDGTLYLGDNVYPGAHELMEALPSLGKRYIYLTNNSSRAGEDYITRLRRLGFPCEAENVFTSGMATGLYLNQNYPGAKVYLAGTKAFYRELQSYRINLVNDELGHTEETSVDVVVQGFDTELVYEKLNLACHFLRRGAAFIAANPDWVCPMPEDEVLPDCGSICALLTASSGVKPTYIGKPNRNMIDVISKQTGIPNDKWLRMPVPSLSWSFPARPHRRWPALPSASRITHFLLSRSSWTHYADPFLRICSSLFCAAAPVLLRTPKPENL